MIRSKAYIVKPSAFRLSTNCTSSVSTKPPFNSTSRGTRGYADSATRPTGPNHNRLRTAPKERAHVRLPIIINGAGPAGLVLANGLQNAKIPFIICERYRHDLPGPRRTHTSLIFKQVLNPLTEFLNFSTFHRLLPHIVTTGLTSGNSWRCDHRIHTEALLKLLRRNVPVNYGHDLQCGGISGRESVMTSQYVAGQTVRTFRGSLLVGADGMFSAVRNNFTAVSAWPAITYVSSIVITKQQCGSDLNLKLDDIALGSGPIRLFGNTRLMLCVYGKTPTHVSLSLMYSPMIISNEDFERFWGFSAGERDIPRVEYQFNPMIKDEIDFLLPLPPPFDIAYELCKSFGISKKQPMNCVRTEGRELPNATCRGGLTMPTVLVGDAAHAVPKLFSDADINRALWDAIHLCDMIVERYDDDRLFSAIAGEFYALKSVFWQNYPLEWARKWMAAHDLPLENDDDRLHWVKLRRVVRIGNEGTELKLDEVPPDKKKSMLKYKKNEEASWEQIQKRLRNQYIVGKAFTPQPGIKSSEIVLRYLDSRSIPDHDAPVDVEDHGINAMPTVGHEYKKNENYQPL